MYCTNCGNPVNAGAVACLSCGASPGGFKKFCGNCGKPVLNESVVCTSCGVALPYKPLVQGSISTGQKDWLTTLLLCILLGEFGVHRFYTGHIFIGVLQLLTLCGFGIWFIIDLVLILTGSYRDAQGNPLYKKP